MDGLLLLTELRHALWQLFQSDQLFLVSGHQSVDLAPQARLFSIEILCALAQGVGFLSFLHSSFDFTLNQSRALEQAQDLLPDQCVKIVLPNRPVLTEGTVKVSPAIGANTAVVVEFVMWFSSSRGSRECIATLLAHQQALQQGGPDGAATSKLLV